MGRAVKIATVEIEESSCGKQNDAGARNKSGAQISWPLETSISRLNSKIATSPRSTAASALTAYQPSRAEPFQQLFLSHFITSFDNRSLHRTQMPSLYWKLPEFLSSSVAPAAAQSIRAATMVYYGVITGDKAIKTAAYRMYSRALESQRLSLEVNKIGQSSTILPTAEMILAPLMLAHFELTTSTTPTGWLQHILGAGKMLELRGPENCCDGIIHLLFRTVRQTTVCIDSWLSFP
jgi:hypothetical protein